MPPKKEEVADGPVVLGRVRNNLSMGIVGLPNVGKSSFFNILCGMSVPAENFPFCTIDPATSRVMVPDERFNWLCERFKPASIVPAHLKVTDIAGLVKGAHEGQGLGNAFLSHIRAVDGIFQMVRVFDDEEIVHVEGTIDPVRDLAIIYHELVMKDLEAINKIIDPLRKVAMSTQKERRKELEVMEQCLETLRSGKSIRSFPWKASDVEHINAQCFLTAKPVVYLLNMSEPDLIRKKNAWLPKIKAWVDEHDHGANIIPLSVALEQKLLTMTPEAREAFTAETKTASSLPKIVRVGYSVLHLIYFFTAGADEVRAWTIHAGTKTPQAAGVIHTDFERGFITADCIRFDDMKEHGSEGACRSAGKVLIAGKTTVVQDGDILHIKANTVGLTKKK